MVSCAKRPDEHDGVSRALVEPRRARRDATEIASTLPPGSGDDRSRNSLEEEDLETHAKRACEQGIGEP
jgi:hypothetical protein